VTAGFWSDCLLDLARIPLRHRELLREMVRRDVVGRYRGSVLGLLWSFLHPVVMLAVFTFVFSEIFKARWGTGTGDSKADFALTLFVGLIIHGLFSECLNRAPGLIVGNPSYVKRVVFPLEIMPWVAVGTTLFHALVSTVVWSAFYLAVHGGVHPTIVYVPLIIAPLALFALGCAWFLASLGVFLRDVGQTTGIITSVLMFLSPVFYPASALPSPYRELIALSPLTVPIELARDAMVVGRAPDWGVLAAYSFVAVLVAVLGLAWFRKTRSAFADVL
jgi:lipopolysaccharide transport system permease protein